METGSTGDQLHNDTHPCYGESSLSQVWLEQESNFQFYFLRKTEIKQF